MATVFEVTLARVVREWDNDGRHHEFRVHVPARKIYDGGIISIGSTCRIVVAGDTVRARSSKRKSAAIPAENVGKFVCHALNTVNRSKGGSDE